MGGALGIHVDHGIGAGDQYFKNTICKLQKAYVFGAYCGRDVFGVYYKQWDDGSIEMDKVGYLQKIEPMEIPRSRRRSG